MDFGLANVPAVFYVLREVSRAVTGDVLVNEIDAPVQVLLSGGAPSQRMAEGAGDVESIINAGPMQIVPAHFLVDLVFGFDVFFLIPALELATGERVPASVVESFRQIRRQTIELLDVVRVEQPIVDQAPKDGCGSLADFLFARWPHRSGIDAPMQAGESGLDVAVGAGGSKEHCLVPDVTLLARTRCKLHPQMLLQEGVFASQTGEGEADRVFAKMGALVKADEVIFVSVLARNIIAALTERQADNAACGETSDFLLLIEACAQQHVNVAAAAY